MFRLVAFLVVMATATFAVAQSGLIVTEVYSGIEGQRPVKSFALQDVRSGAELWLNDAYGVTWSVDMVGPQIRYKGKHGALSTGLYTRFTTKEVQRLGLSGVFVLGKPTDWQLAGQYYAFDVPRGNRLGGSVPNARMTYPFGREFRAGIGLGVTSIQGQAVNAAVGPYLCWRNKQWFIQLRVGGQLSPPSLERRTQVFLRVDYRF